MVPSGHLSPQLGGNGTGEQQGRMVAPAYTTTGRPSPHQQQPMSFTKALDVAESLEGGAGRGQQQQQPQQPVSILRNSSQQQQQPPPPPQGDNGRDSVYDMNSYEISV